MRELPGRLRRAQAGRPEATVISRPRHHQSARRRWPFGRLVLGAMLIILASCLLVMSSGLDSFLHRGVVYGLPQVRGGGLSLGMNVFLEKEPEQQNILRSIEMLKAGGVTYVRQSFPWQDIERAPGTYRTPDGQDTWAKYDFIVEQLSKAGIRILARVDTIPQWARPATDNFQRYDKGPPQDFNNYANFVAVLAARYKSQIIHFQVWNEPNLDGEWGGKPISPAQYGLLLRYTSERVKAVNPNALIVTAGLAQTTEDGVTTNNLNELDFIQGLYDAGAAPYFDILSVMDYGLGHSPEDRRVGPERTNFSRLLLARDVMVRNNDSQKPIWVSEYGWISLPANWTGDRGSWGTSVDEDTQARWTIEGLNRMQREWPWVTNVFVWGFRWVERPADTLNQPARYFEVVDHDFTPRPAYVALQQWSSNQQIATSGILSVRDPRLHWSDGWRDQTLGGQQYRITNTPGATVSFTFRGTDIQLNVRAGGTEGQLYALIDGQPVRGLRADKEGTYLLLRDGSSQVHDASLTLASGLADQVHTVELRYGAFGDTALTGMAIGRRQPFNWLTAFLVAASLLSLGGGFWLIGRALLVRYGLLSRRPLQDERNDRWWQTGE